MNNVWKFAATALAGALISAIVVSYSVGRNVVTKDDLQTEMPAMIAQYSPYTGDAKAIAVELSSLKETIRDNTTSHTEQYQHIEDQITQIQEDLARVAAKAGVTAHPGPSEK